MSGNSIGEKLRVTLFGQSHAPAVGAVIEGYPAGRRIDRDSLAAFMARRAPGRNAWSTGRKEPDRVEFLSGLDGQGVTCGFPIVLLIRNTDARSADYDALRSIPRPGHADYAAFLKYGGSLDMRGGGPFSGRMTAPLCAAGALCLQYLRDQGVEISAHIARIGSVEDESPDPVRPRLPLYPEGAFPVINEVRGQAMIRAMEEARQAGDSLDGVIRCVITGLPGGLGGPLFGGLEGRLSPALFGIPAVKGVLFGDIRPRGSLNNDPFILENGRVRTETNHCGGVLGGISTGMPLIFTVHMKPTSSISLPQRSVNLETMAETEISVSGRHDPCVAPRAVPAVEAAAAIVLADMILEGA